MKFIAIDRLAAMSIVSMRNLQSSEYESGLQLASILQNGLIDNLFFDDVGATPLKEGVAFLSKKPDLSAILVFDLEQFNAFSICAEADMLSVFQKTCRTALKYWESIPFSSREFFKPEKDLIVLIPKKNSIGDGSKVLIDIRPDANRQEKRETRHLLAFYYGKDAITEKPATTSFRKAVEQFKEINLAESSGTERDLPLKVDHFVDNFTPIDSTTSFSSWEKLLTSTQKGFVFRENYGPERIEGAAGTGKTLSLALRCCNILEKKYNQNDTIKIAFITHSNASKEYIENIIFPKISWYRKEDKSIELNVITLQDWCIQSLGNKIEETELLDKDAQSSKEYQQLLIADVLSDFETERLETHKKFISDELVIFFKEESDLKIQALQHEIAEIIKGRSGQDLTKYKKTIASNHFIPIRTESDFDCIYSLYSLYQEKLEFAGYFDSDDIILSALGQLDSPIWRRRKNNEGYDVLFVDETHLFNINELSIIHHLLKDKKASNIIYSIDRSQSIANISLEASEIDEALGNSTSTKVNLKTIFRSSPDIVKLAFSVLSSGSTIFTKLENPLYMVEDSFTSTEEKRSKKPYCIKYVSDEAVIENAFKAADKLANETGSKKSKVIIIATTDSILTALERYSIDTNKASEFIKKRGDKKTQHDAEKGNKFIISGIDYVGGLEFDAALIVGADKGHLPDIEESGADSKHFLNHAAYNRLYTAITRAKYGVALSYNGSRGLSRLLDHPFSEGLLDNLDA